MSEEMLSPRQLRQGIRYLLLSMAIWCVFGACTSGSLLSGLLVSLQFSPEKIGLLMSLSLFGLPMQLVGSYLQMRFFHRKRFWVTLCIAYYLSYLVLALLAWRWECFPLQLAVLGFFVLYGTTQFIGNAFNAVQLGWMSDILPSSESNSFWNRRTGIAISGTVILGILVGCVVDCLGHRDSSSYAKVIAFGSVVAFLSLYCCTRVPDPTPYRKKDVKLLELLLSFAKNRDIRQLTLFFAFQSVCNWLMCGLNLVYLQKTMNFSQTVVQSLLGLSGVISFLSGYLFTVLGNRYGRKPLVIICSALKSVEFLFWGIMLPCNTWFDGGILALCGKCGLSLSLLPAGFFTALPAFILGGFVNMGLTSCQMVMLTSLGKKESQGVMIGFFYTFVGFAGAIASAASGYLYGFIEQSALSGMLNLSPFNILALIGGAGYLLSCIILLPYRELGAASTVKVVRSLFGHNPFRTIYMAIVLGTPVVERKRANVLRRADQELNDNELANALCSASSVVRESALLKVAGDTVLETAQEKALLEQLKLPGTAMRSAVAKLLGQKGTDAVLPELAAGIASNDAEFACACIYALGWRNWKGCLPALREILKSEDAQDERRGAAADAVGRMGSFEDADDVFHAYETERNYVLSKQCLLSVCRLFAKDAETVLRLFDAEEKAPGSSIEKIVSKLFHDDFNGVMKVFEKKDYAQALEIPLRRLLGRAGVALPQNLAYLLVGGKVREGVLSATTPQAAALRCMLKLWGFLSYEGEKANRFELLAALSIAEAAATSMPG